MHLFSTFVYVGMLASALAMVSAPLEDRSSSKVGQAIVNAALTQLKVPYVLGGGNCNGKTHGGFDCSGLTEFAICKATHKKTDIPTTAHLQYHSKKGKHLPRSQAKPGDLLFWADGRDCKKDHIAHTAIFIKKGQMVAAPHKGKSVQKQGIWTSYGGEHICPDVVRFW